MEKKKITLYNYNELFEKAQWKAHSDFQQNLFKGVYHKYIVSNIFDWLYELTEHNTSFVSWSTGYVHYAVSVAKAYGAIFMAEEEIKQKAIEAFKFATDGYFIIGGTDYSGNRLKEFIEKLNS